MYYVKIDRDDPALLHEQVAAQIRQAIADGEAKPGDRLPQRATSQPSWVSTRTPSCARCDSCATKGYSNYAEATAFASSGPRAQRAARQSRRIRTARATRRLHPHRAGTNDRTRHTCSPCWTRWPTGSARRPGGDACDEHRAHGRAGAIPQSRSPERVYHVRVLAAIGSPGAVSARFPSTKSSINERPAFTNYEE